MSQAGGPVLIFAIVEMAEILKKQTKAVFLFCFLNSEQHRLSYLAEIRLRGKIKSPSVAHTLSG